jgi:uncharacterized protein YijF (DUF1287 family)
VAAAERHLAGFARTGHARARQGLAEASALAASLSPRTVQAAVRSQFYRLRDEARALALPYSHDEREALALLFLPFLLVASAVVVYQSARTLAACIPVISLPDREVAAVRPDADPSLPLSAVPHALAREVRPALISVRTLAAAETIRPVQETARAIGHTPLDRTVAAVEAPETLSRVATAEADLAPVPAPPPAAAPETTLALIAPLGGLGSTAVPVLPPPLDAYEADRDGNPIYAGICSVAEAATPVTTASLPEDAGPMSLTPDAFGLRLAAAAEAQVGQLVIYNDAYRRISYPMGDVPSLFGVCTDVIVRAYRAIGLDLQALVHEARAGRGDPSIDHRRTEILRRFFSAHGESLPVTSFAEDYRPGDIVTYHRPQNRGMRAHIAMVSSVMAPSGRPMIVHNRGWGPQLEDALFVDQITGHYRYRGPSTVRNAAGLDNGAPREPTPRRAVEPAGLTTASPIVPAAFRTEPPTAAVPPSAARH